MIRSQAIAKFLTDFSQHPVKYHPGLEVQVNVIPGIEKTKYGWTDGANTWNHFRIPRNAKSEPKDNDNEIRFDLSQHALAIGCTGWNWQQQRSEWVGFDLDSIINHKKGLDNAELGKTIASLSSIDFITIVRSTSGAGYHVYISINPSIDVVVSNHTEHIALARAILDELSGISGLDLKAKFDSYGSILWLWHKNQSNNAFEVIKHGNSLNNIPSNWRNYIVKKRGYHKSEEFSHEAFSLDDEHVRLIRWLGDKGYSRWWDNEKQLLVCHTYNLKQAHEELKLRGIFNTVATGDSGASGGSDWNCFAVPVENGGWLVRRFNPGTVESKLWFRDTNNYTTTYFNSHLSINDISQIEGCVQKDNKHIQLRPGEWRNIVRCMGAEVKGGDALTDRGAVFKQLDARTIKIIVKRHDNDSPIDNWTEEKGNWVQVIQLPSDTIKTRVPHGKIRYVANRGWFCNTDNGWIEVTKGDAISYLKHMGYKDVDRILGKAIVQHWTIVNEPFEPQYLPKRQWNMFAAQLSCEPRQGEHPTWDRILDHIGQTLTPYVEENQYCQLHHIETGASYLLHWIANLIQHPKSPLPYLFLYGPQNTGKSTLHEAIGLLFKERRGYVGAKVALCSKEGFNAEIAGAILCFVEELDLSNAKTLAYSRVKDWVTALRMTIHEKRVTPFDISNTTHWIQCGNKMSDCPILPGDTRITTVFVDRFKTEINKAELQNQLRKERAAFLHTIMNIELPLPEGRLNMPVIETGDKALAEEKEENDVDGFIREYCYYVEGTVIKFSDFYEHMVKETGSTLTKQEVGRLLPPQFPRGKWKGTGQFYIGNISWTNNQDVGNKLIRIGDRLKEVK